MIPLKHLKYLPLAIPAALAGVSLTSLFTPPPTPALSTIAVPGGINVEKIRKLGYYATSQSCSAEGCILAVDQSVKAMHTFLGIPKSWDEDRDFYPINGISDGVFEPPKVVVYYRIDPDKGYKDSKAYQIWVPVYSRLK